MEKERRDILMARESAQPATRPRQRTDAGGKEQEHSGAAFGCQQAAGTRESGEESTQESGEQGRYKGIKSQRKTGKEQTDKRQGK